MHPSHHARTHPGKPAYIMAASGETVTYGELDARSNQGAHLLRSAGIAAGDAIAIFMDNSPRYYEVLWAAQRSGVRFTCISSKLTAGEVEYIVERQRRQGLHRVRRRRRGRPPGGSADPGREAVDGRWRQAAVRELRGRPLVHADHPDRRRNAQARRCCIPQAPQVGPRGSSGRRAAGPQPIDAPNGLSMIGQTLLGFSPDMIYLSPAPLYHAAPLGWSMAVQATGGTVVMMERFEPEAALDAIEKYKVTSAQWVPTHFVRMLKLPPRRARSTMFHR